MKKRAPRIGDGVHILFERNSKYKEVFQFALAWTESREAGEISFLLDCLESEKLVRLEGQHKVSVITAKGHSRLLSDPNPSSNQAFVAMWLSTETEDAYNHGIVPAVSKSGYVPLRIDKKEHSNKIDDEIIAEIRKSRFLVADFTCGSVPVKIGNEYIPRGGVYYEAGFA